MENAAIKIQLAWRRRDAKNLVKHMKLRKQREEEEENKAALTIQLAWRRKKGSMVSRFYSPKPKKGIPSNTSFIHTLRSKTGLTYEKEATG